MDKYINLQEYASLIAYLDRYIEDIQEAMTSITQLAERCNEVLESDVIGEITENKTALCIELLKKSVQEACEMREKIKKKYDQMLEVINSYI